MSLSTITLVLNQLPRLQTMSVSVCDGTWKLADYFCWQTVFRGWETEISASRRSNDGTTDGMCTLIGFSVRKWSETCKVIYSFILVKICRSEISFCVHNISVHNIRQHIQSILFYLICIFYVLSIVTVLSDTVDFIFTVSTKFRLQNMTIFLKNWLSQYLDSTSTRGGQKQCNTWAAYFMAWPCCIIFDHCEYWELIGTPPCFSSNNGDRFLRLLSSI